MTEEFLFNIWRPIISFLEIALLYYFLHQIEYKSKTKIKPWLAYGLLLVAEMCMTTLEVNSFVKLFVLFALVFILCNILYRVSPRKAALLTLIYMMLLIVGEVMAFAILMIFSPELQMHLVNESFVLYLEGNILSKSLDFTLLVIINRILNKNHEEYGFHEFCLMFVPAIANIIVLFFMINYSYIDVTKGKDTGVDMLLVSFVMAVSSVLSILFFEKYMKNKQDEQRLQLMEQQIKMQNKYYQDKEVVNDQVKKMYHDMNNHLIAMKQMDSELKYNDYLKELSNHLEDYQSYIETGNKMVDVLMNEKIMMMNQFDIIYSGIINLELVTFIKDIDVVTIFGNAIDNAIEATKQITKGERYIKITTASMGQFYMMKFINSMTGELRVENNRILTTKGNRHAHGIGLGNIESAVKKYGGIMQIEAENNQFQLIIMIPMQDNDEL